MHVAADNVEGPMLNGKRVRVPRERDDLAAFIEGELRDEPAGRAVRSEDGELHTTVLSLAAPVIRGGYTNKDAGDARTVTSVDATAVESADAARGYVSTLR
jgi:hypothetical protein